MTILVLWGQFCPWLWSCVCVSVSLCECQLMWGWVHEKGSYHPSQEKACTLFGNVWQCHSSFSRLLTCDLVLGRKRERESENCWVMPHVSQFPLPSHPLILSPFLAPGFLSGHTLGCSHWPLKQTIFKYPGSSLHIRNCYGWIPSLCLEAITLIVWRLSLNTVGGPP